MAKAHLKARVTTAAKKDTRPSTATRRAAGAKGKVNENRVGKRRGSKEAKEKEPDTLDI